MSKNEDLKYDFAIAESDIVDENKEIISDDEADVDDNMVLAAQYELCVARQPLWRSNQAHVHRPIVELRVCLHCQLIAYT